VHAESGRIAALWEEYAMKFRTGLIIALLAGALIAGGSTSKTSTVSGRCEVQNSMVNCWGLRKSVPIGLLPNSGNLGALHNDDVLECNWEASSILGVSLPTRKFIIPACHRPRESIFQLLSRASRPGFRFYLTSQRFSPTAA
jgi:hypothetical protein